MNREQFALLLIKQKLHNIKFGEVEYFGGSNVVKKSYIVKDPPLEVAVMPKRQMKMRRTISIGWSAPIYENVDEPENCINFIMLKFSEKSYHLLIISLGPFNLLK